MVGNLKHELARAEAYLEGLEDSLKLLPQEIGGVMASANLREGTDLAKARDIIRKEQKPLHVDELLKRLGKEINRTTKGALAGSISAYARKGAVFTRTAPNTFGLAEFDQAAEQPQPPEGFGLPSNS
jgi:hypothetical protein